MNKSSKKGAAPLDDVMLAMDVVDTLRYRQDLVLRELDGEAKEKQLIKRLREIYRLQGIDVPDNILKSGVLALSESRFSYEPPAGGFGTLLARLYVGRGRWGRWVMGAILALFVAIAGYQLVYLPRQSAEIENTRIELSEALPAKMDELYDSIFADTKVQAATLKAEEIRKRGKIAAAEGNRAEALEAVNSLSELRDLLRLEYSLTIVNREGERSGFWTFPEINTDATNYYLVVEALTDEGEKLLLPVLNEETGTKEIVDIWGVRISQELYESVVSDKRDDGIIQRNNIGKKSYGYMDVTYAVPVLGGAVTRW